MVGPSHGRANQPVESAFLVLLLKQTSEEGKS